MVLLMERGVEKGDGGEGEFGSKTLFRQASLTFRHFHPLCRLYSETPCLGASEGQPCFSQLCCE